MQRVGLFGVSASEMKKVALLFSFFFLVIAAFWTLKPIRTSSVIKAFGSDYYPLFKTGAVLFIPVVIMLHSVLMCYFSRESLVKLFTTVFLVASWVFWAFYEYAPGPVVKIGFYFFVDIYITVMVTVFWTYLNDVYSSGEARKFYGVIGAGGLVGGIIGSLVVATMSESLGNHIILVVTVFLVPIFFIIHRLKGIAGSQEADTRRETAVCGHEGKTPIAVMFEGGTTILASKYLICILAIVGVYEVISTWVDYLFFATLSDSIESRDAMSAYTGKVFTVAMFVALFVQVFVTTLVHRRWGVFYGLLFLPMTLLLGSAAFFFMPILMVIALTIAGEAAFGYSINQASKEILYVPLGTIAKYKSKAVIDMFVLRGGKAVGGIVLIAYTLWLSHHGFTSRFLMGLSVACVFLWLVAVRHIGRTFAEKERMEQARL